MLNHTITGAGAPLVVRPMPHSSTIELNGTIAPTSERVLRNVSVQNPTIYFGNAVRDGLTRNGIEVVGPAIDIDDLGAPLDRSNAVMNTEVVSKGLSVIAATMMKLSQNLYAETLLKTIGNHASGLGSTAAGRAVVDSTLTSWGVAAGEVSDVDGSGLSRYNLVTADALATVLRHVYQDAAAARSFYRHAASRRRRRHARRAHERHGGRRQRQRQDWIIFECAVCRRICSNRRWRAA